LIVNDLPDSLFVIWRYHGLSCRYRNNSAMLSRTKPAGSLGSPTGFRRLR
jgi:hypothetical protein